MARDQLYAILRYHAARLDEPLREVLMLYYFAGHNAREIGALMEMPHGAVRKRLQRAREALGHKLLAEVEGAAEKDAPPEQEHRLMAVVTVGSAPWEELAAPAGATSAVGVGVAMKGAAGRGPDVVRYLLGREA